MKKKIIIITCAVLAIAALVCLAPWPTWVDVTLHTVKLDQYGNQVGDADIHIKGMKFDYLLREDVVSWQIDPFEGHTSLFIGGSAERYVEVYRNDHKEYSRVLCGSLDNDRFLGELAFNDTLDKWAFKVFTSTPTSKYATVHYYVAFTEDSCATCTAEELIKYFQGFIHINPESSS